MREASRPLVRRSARGRLYYTAWFGIGATGLVYVQAYGMVREYIILAQTLQQQGQLKYILWSVATLFALLMIRAEPRWRERSRAAGGSGLRFGQGPLPSWERLDRWLDRWADTLVGYLAIIPFWLVKALALVAFFVVRFLWLLLLTTLVCVAAYSGAALFSESYLGPLLLLFLATGSFLMIRVFKRTSRRFPNACSHLVLLRIFEFTNRALDRLIPTSPPADPPDDRNERLPIQSS